MVTTRSKSTLHPRGNIGAGTDEHAPARTSKRTRPDDPDDDANKPASKRLYFGCRTPKRKAFHDDLDTPNSSKRTKTSPATPQPQRRTRLRDMLFSPKNKAVPKITLQPPTPTQSRIPTPPPQDGNTTKRRKILPNDPTLLHPTWKKTPNLPRRVLKQQPTKIDPMSDNEPKGGESSGRNLTHKLRSLAERVNCLTSSLGEKKPKSKGKEGSKAPGNIPGLTGDPKMVEGTAKSTHKRSMTGENADIPYQTPKKAPKRPVTDPSKTDTSAKSPEQDAKIFVFSDAEIASAAAGLAVLSNICEENRKPDADTQKLLLDVMGGLPEPITRRNRRQEYRRAKEFMEEVCKQPGAESWKDVEALDALENRLRLMYKFEGCADAPPSKVKKRKGTMYSA